MCTASEIHQFSGISSGQLLLWALKGEIASVVDVESKVRLFNAAHRIEQFPTNSENSGGKNVQ
jgi:hypothetical protein